MTIVNMAAIHENEVKYDIVRELSSGDVLLDLSVRNPDTNVPSRFVVILTRLGTRVLL